MEILPAKRKSGISRHRSEGSASILSVIGFPELVNTAKNVVAETFLSFQTWGIVAIMYLIVILLLQWLAKVLERRLKYESK